MFDVIMVGGSGDYIDHPLPWFMPVPSSKDLEAPYKHHTTIMKQYILDNPILSTSPGPITLVQVEQLTSTILLKLKC